MALRQTSPLGLLILLCIAGFLAQMAQLMLGPLLVRLAHEFQTSVAMVGQLAGAAAIAKGVTALVAGPVSDAYGRRKMLLTGLILMAVGMFGAALAWNYGTLLGFCMLTGIGGALVPPNSIATLSEVFPPDGRGKSIGWFISAAGLGAALGLPLVAYLLDVGGWRLPFYTLGAALIAAWSLLWVWFPPDSQQLSQSLSLFSHYRVVGANMTVWYALAANALQQMVFFGLFAYLATYLMQTYTMNAGDTALPLALAGLGTIVAGFLGGQVADHRHRLTVFALTSVGSGVLAALVFTTQMSPWVTVSLAFGVASLARISSTVTPTLLLERAGSSRTTATGLSALSIQLGGFGGPSLGGLMLALSGFHAVGLLCFAVAVAAAAVIRFKVQDTAGSEPITQPGH